MIPKSIFPSFYFNERRKPIKLFYVWLHEGTDEVDGVLGLVEDGRAGLGGL